MSLGEEVRRGQADEFTSRDDLGLFPELRKMPAISRDQVIRTGSGGIFQKKVVVGIAVHVQAGRRGDDMAADPDELHQL